MGLTARLSVATAAWTLLGTCVALPMAGAADRPVSTAALTVSTVLVDDGFDLSGRLIQGGAVTGRVPKGTTELRLDAQPVAIAEDGRFLIAFDRDARANAALVARMQGGREVRRQLEIAPRAWSISRLDTLRKYPVPRPEFEKLRATELAEINASRNIRSDSEGWRQKMVWPVTGRISTLFGSQRIYAGEPGSYHSGIDIARPTGTPIVAPADGIVVLATSRPFSLEGYLLIIDHGAGLSSAFMHLSRIDVRAGERVQRGQPVAAIGSTGRSTGPHLHWGLKWHDARIDPLLVAGPMPVTN